MYYHSVQFSRMTSYNLVVPNSVETKECALAEPIYFGGKGSESNSNLFPQDVKCSTGGIKCAVLR